MENNKLNGLSSQDVLKQMEAGKSNKVQDPTKTSIKQIIYRNIFTLFNILNVALAILVVFTKEYRNMLFLGVVFCNLVIGIFQEIRAKKIIDRLKLINDPYFTVIRDGDEVKVHMNDIVQDDIILLMTGQQIPADSQLLDGNLEVNESLLTGESDTVVKKIDDTLYSGTYIVAGHGYVQAIRVGSTSTMHTIINEAKSKKTQPSILRDALNLIIKTVTALIVPVGILLFLKQYFITGTSLNESILATVAAMIGMIPEGLVLLTSVTLALGALALTRKNTLTQELYSLETLARVNMLCLDKTGTLTKGCMHVKEIIKYNDNIDVDNYLANVINALNDDNSTALAIKKHLSITNEITATKLIPFSSERKYSGAVYQTGTFLLGAEAFINVELSPEATSTILNHRQNGNRVLAFGYSDEICGESLPTKTKLLGLIILSDPIRESAHKTLDYFESQGVAIKIISGDDPNTVAYVAQNAGVKHAEFAIDCHGKSDEEIEELIISNFVFGRVSPHQKKLMIITLKKHGYVTAMVGDGVNDVMALKAADCSIAMKDGSDASKNTANLILLDNDFASMPEIVNQGRRVINNIQRTATLFLTKTVFSLLLAFLTIFFIKQYPFYPIQLTLISSFCIGVPAFFLSLEPNYNIVEGNFIANIFSKAIPCGITIVLAIIFYQLLAIFITIPIEVLSTMIMVTTSIILFAVLVSLTKKLNLYRLSLLLFIAIGLIICFVFLKDLFLLAPLGVTNTLITSIISALGVISLRYIDQLNLATKLAKLLKKKS